MGGGGGVKSKILTMGGLREGEGDFMSHNYLLDLLPTVYENLCQVFQVHRRQLTSTWNSSGIIIW